MRRPSFSPLLGPPLSLPFPHLYKRERSPSMRVKIQSKSCDSRRARLLYLSPLLSLAPKRVLPPLDFPRTPRSMTLRCGARRPPSLIIGSFLLRVSFSEACARRRRSFRIFPAVHHVFATGFSSSLSPVVPPLFPSKKSKISYIRG